MDVNNGAFLNSRGEWQMTDAQTWWLGCWKGPFAIGVAQGFRHKALQSYFLTTPLPVFRKRSQEILPLTADGDVILGVVGVCLN
jgi:hypothetical protein